MNTIQLNSTDWSTQKPVTFRGVRSADAAPPSDFPGSFLTEDSKVALEFSAQPKAATRDKAGQAAPAGPLDFSCDLAPGEAAILAIRHPSGALTFHLPVQATSRGLRQSSQVRFVVNVRSADVAACIEGVKDGTIDCLATDQSNAVYLCNLAGSEGSAPLQADVWKSINGGTSWTHGVGSLPECATSCSAFGVDRDWVAASILSGKSTSKYSQFGTAIVR